MIRKRIKILASVLMLAGASLLCASVIANISQTPLAEVVRGTMPFVVLMLMLLMLITYVPIFSVWLPGLMMAK